MREKTSKAEIASVCQIRLMTGLPCERCTYNDTIARRRYHTNVETFKIGSISTLELSDAQKAKDQARIGRIQQLFNYWYYYYQLRSIALWDFERGCELTADVERLIEH